MSKIITIIVLVVVVVGGFMFFRNRGSAPTEMEMNNTENTEGTNETSVNTNVKEFTVDAGSFYFRPATMQVNVGDTVRITLNNSGGVHDWKLDEFNAATRVLNAGESQTIEFVATKAGSFEYYCSVGNHRQMGMVGTLTVR